MNVFTIIVVSIIILIFSLLVWESWSECKEKYYKYKDDYTFPDDY